MPGLATLLQISVFRRDIRILHSFSYGKLLPQRFPALPRRAGRANLLETAGIFPSRDPASRLRAAAMPVKLTPVSKQI